MIELETAGACRDGGSIAIDLIKNGRRTSILLEVAYNESRELIYDHLHVGEEVQNRCDPETIVTKNSEQEKSVMSMVTEWLNQNSTDAQRLTAKTTPPKGVDQHLYNIYWCVQFLEKASVRNGNDEAM